MYSLVYTPNENTDIENFGIITGIVNSKDFCRQNVRLDF